MLGPQTCICGPVYIQSLALREDVFNLGMCTGWCFSVWKWGHVCVLLWRGAERRPRLYQHPGRSLGCSTRCVVRSWWEPSGFLRCRRNCHCVETWTATSWPAYHVNWPMTYLHDLVFHFDSDGQIHIESLSQISNLCVWRIEPLMQISNLKPNLS